MNDSPASQRMNLAARRAAWKAAAAARPADGTAPVASPPVQTTPDLSAAPGQAETAANSIRDRLAANRIPEASTTPKQPEDDEPARRADNPDQLFDNFEDGLDAAATYPNAEERAAEDLKMRQIEAIRGEGLTMRQLRMIRRVGEVHKLSFKSPYEALWLLRQQGIDPTNPAKSAEAIRAELSEDPDQDLTMVPANTGRNLPSTELRHEEIRLNDIRLIQRDIVRRRQRKTVLLFTRLAIFVLLPTIIAFFYFRDVAAKLYETESQFVIQMASPPGATTSMAASPLLTAQDAMNVQAYLLSRDAMLRLDRDVGFRSHFSQPQIDALQRLEMDSTQEEMFKTYKRMIKIGFDPTEGIVKMRVSATDPETSKAITEVLLGYAEQQVDSLTARLREDQMKGAREIYEESEQKMLAAQDELISLQKRIGSIDPTAEGEAVSKRIAGYEDEIQQKRLELASLLDNPEPSAARVDGVRTDIARLEAALAALRTAVSTPGTGDDTASLADLNSEVTRAELELQTRVKLLQQSLTNLEAARIEADRQVRYLSVNVAPIAPDVPTYPRVIENTILTFLILMGIYLMLSLTVAILREQVSA
jgi:capsular polysaccharide transport system permease protein